MKPALRKKARRKTTSRTASAVIQERLREQDWWAAAGPAGVYRSIPGEPATEVLLADLLARKARAAVPARCGKSYRWAWVDETTRWRNGAHGIPEPVQAQRADPAGLRIIVVPGVAFDSRGGRLGHGGGHFDRLLAQSPGALLVGLCFETRRVAAVPLASHDIPMDVVVTEKRIWCSPTAGAKLETLLGGGDPGRGEKRGG